MDDRIKFLPAVLAFTALSLPGILFAATGHVKFEVVGQSSCTKETASGATTLAIGQQCPAGAPIITISTASLDTDGTSDTSQDAWRMPWTVSITANQAVSNLHLIFLREAAQGPTATYYKAWAKGGVSGGSGTIRVTGFVKEISSPQDTITIGPFTCSAGNGSSFDCSTVKQWTPGSLTLNRELKVDLEIVSLTQNATLNLALGGGGFIKLRSQGTPDDGPVCNYSGNWLVTTSCTFDPDFDRPSYKDVQLKHSYEFAKYNWENLSQDMAQGQGEYLVSLATLLNVPAQQQRMFFEFAQGKYRTYTGVETPEQVVASLHKTWNSR